MPPAVAVPGADFFDVVGTPRWSGTVCFVPALLDVVPPVATEPWPAARLAERIAATPGGCDEVRRQLAEDPDGVVFHPHWARSRVSAVFGWAPPTGPDRPSLLEIGFVAVAEVGGEWHADPFVRSDLWHEMRLEFGPATGPDRRKEVAAAFWDLLLADPFGLVPFREAYTFDADCDPSEGVGGLDRGGFFDEGLWLYDWEEDEPEAEYSPHATALSGEVWVCPECGGSGEESFCPAGATCEECGGSGQVC